MIDQSSLLIMLFPNEIPQNQIISYDCHIYIYHFPGQEPGKLLLRRQAQNQHQHCVLIRSGLGGSKRDRNHKCHKYKKCEIENGKDLKYTVYL